MHLGNPLKKKFHGFEPKKPKPGKVKYKYDVLGYTGSRQNHFPNDSPEYEDEYDDDSDVIAMSDRTSLSLKEVNTLIKKKDINEKDVFFTASLDEDYLNLKIVHVTKMSDEDQIKEYNEAHAEWEEQEKEHQRYEEERVQQDILRLQRRAEELKKKKK